MEEETWDKVRVFQKMLNLDRSHAVEILIDLGNTKARSVRDLVSDVSNGGQDE
jgi:hypothetical protein